MLPADTAGATPLMSGWDLDTDFVVDLRQKAAKKLLGVLLLRTFKHALFHGRAHSPWRHVSWITGRQEGEREKEGRQEGKEVKVMQDNSKRSYDRQ